MPYGRTRLTDWLLIQFYLFLIFYVIFLHTFCSSCEVCYLKSHILSAFDGKAVTDFPLETKSDKLWMCSKMCGRDTRCRSYRYNTMTVICSTYGVGYSLPGNTFNPVTVETGSQLYLMCERTHSFGTQCTVDTDCDYSNSDCKDGSCECGLGYSYDVTSGGCDAHCTSYADFFVDYVDHGVGGCNTGSATTSSPRECMETCRDQTSFVCVNAEYQVSSGSCFMCHLAWYDLSPSSRNTADSGWILYHRHCQY